jgi:hypothetical protein
MAEKAPAQGRIGSYKSARRLHATAKDHLQLLVLNLGNAQTRLSSSHYGVADKDTLVMGGVGGKDIIGVTLEGTVIDTLRKIAFNTAATTNNTARIAGAASTSVSLYAGVFSDGGWVGGRPHSMGGTHIEAELGEHITNRMSANANRSLLDAINDAHGPLDISGMSGMNRDFGSASNVVPFERPIPIPIPARAAPSKADNPELVAAVKENTEELKKLQKMVAAGGNGTVRVLSDIKEQISESVEGGSKRVAGEIRMTGRMIQDRASLGRVR